MTTTEGRGVPPSAGVRDRHIAALDGLRALAIAGVIAYHLGFGWAAGGYLGVDLFFVLSGFLITSLLLEERLAQGRISLAAFWGRRAKRLLPALLTLLAVSGLVSALGLLRATLDPSALRSDALAALAYVANWHLMVAGQSYFAAFSAPSPLEHTWSLAIEEQFYAIWPLALAAGLYWARGVSRQWLTAATALGAAASAAWMGWLSAGGAGFDRLYYGTDTRAFDLLAGAALALWAVGRPQPSPRRAKNLHWAALAAVAVLAMFWWRAGAVSGPPRFMFEGGMALCAVGCAVVLADLSLTMSGPLHRLLDLRPLVGVGRISYGLYLWHWPVITQMTRADTGLGGAPLALARLSTILALALASYALVERPWRRPLLARWPRPARVALAPLTMTVISIALVLATVPAAQAQAGPAVADGQAPGAGGLASSAALTLAASPPSAAHPLRVTLIGDSVMRDEAPAVAAALGGTGVAVVHDQSYPGWGLANDHAWAGGLAQVLAQQRPALIVATWSWDDDWALSDPSRYRSALQRFVQMALHPGGGIQGATAVVFEQFPLVGPNPASADHARRVAGVAAWNNIASRVAKQFPGQVLYLPLAPAVELAGHYATWLPPAGDASAPVDEWVRVRSIDGTHLCPAGAARYALALATDLHEVAAMPLPGSAWWGASWVHDAAVYDTPTGSCPADHPA